MSPTMVVDPPAPAAPGPEDPGGPPASGPGPDAGGPGKPSGQGQGQGQEAPGACRDRDSGDCAVRVRAEYVLAERPACLAPPPEPEAGGGGGGTDGDGGAPPQSQSKRSKNRRGQNKKRPRDARASFAEKACLAVVRGRPCPYANSERGCRYNHDLRQMLADRPDDIAEVEGGCPAFNLNGYCDFGVMCRFGSSHVNMSTGQNLCRTTDEDGNHTVAPPSDEPVCPPCDVAAAPSNGGANEPTQTPKKLEKLEPGAVLGHQSQAKNILSKKTLQDLRKKKYPFVCKRHFEEKKKPDGKRGNENRGGASGREGGPPAVAPGDRPPPAASASTPALPARERKLIDFRNKVYVAPLTTVGNLPFRRIMKSHGADITCGEMALADQLLQGRPGEWALLKRHPSEDVFGVQIAAGHADQYTRVAEVLANEEEMDVDFVDLNLGCPIDLVCDRGAGASLMLRERKLRGSLEGMLRVLDVPVTIKMRTGWSEGSPIAHQLVPKIQGWGIEGIGAVMIHGRSRLQRYSRLAKWDYIGQVARSQRPELPQIPVIGNGDIFTYTDYEEKILDQIDDGDSGGNKNNLMPTAMLGRGALIKPWLPTEIKERRHWDISATERLDMLKDFVRYGLEHWGTDQQGVNQTRRFLLEWMSFLHRYVPVGMLEVIPQQMNHRPPNNMCGRSDLETLMLSKNCADWIKISEMLLGRVPEGFRFEPKHKANSYSKA